MQVFLVFFFFCTHFLLKAEEFYTYVGNFTSNTLSVIDATNSVIATIDVGEGPEDISVSPDGKYVYVCNYTANTLSVISVAENSVIHTITLLQNANPAGSAFTPDGSYL
jgi:YVTN family beta-propeller protein